MGILHAADEELLTALRLLAAQVALPAPDWSALPQLRYRISRAMAARHKIVNDRPALDSSMVEAALALRQRYTAHVGKWTPAAIGTQWPAYCTDSRALISAIRGHVEAYNRMAATRAALAH
ncbi:hypothetical protein ACG3SL_06385 [Sphingomonas sp. CJ20]